MHHAGSLGPEKSQTRSVRALFLAFLTGKSAKNEPTAGVHLHHPGLCQKIALPEDSSSELCPGIHRLLFCQLSLMR